MLDGVLCSPPYAESNQDYRNFSYIDMSKCGRRQSRVGRASEADYGRAPGQLGNLAGPFPYGDTPMPDCEWQDWQNCYENGWNKDLLVAEAFAHPAKMSRTLLERILDYGLAQGFWREGSLIGDPFGGVGTTGLLAAYRGMPSISVELEERFVALAQQNIDLHRRPLTHLGYPLPVIVRGDSRQFAALVGEALAGCVTSPPYAESLNAQHNGIDTAKLQKASAGQKRGPGTKHAETFTASGLGYSADPANIGNLPAGSIEGVVTSPPYADTPLNPGESSRPEAKIARLLAEGNVKDAETIRRCGSGRANNLRQEEYGTTPGQIGALPAGTLDGAVTAPPWEESIASGKLSDDMKAEMRSRGHKPSASGESADYGTAEGQVGRESGESYWQACRDVYGQVRQALRPGGCFVLVVKDYVSKKKRVPLCDQTAQLLTHLGFEVFLRCRCWLVKETRHPSLFGGDIVETTERKSFFRRLAEKKGSPRIDWEEVIWCRRR